MNIIKVKINFKKGTCDVSGIKLITYDYASTTIKFQFDNNSGTHLFTLLDPLGNIAYSDIINNNEIPLYKMADVTTEHDNKTYVKYLDINEDTFWYNSDDDKLFDDEWNEISNFDLDDYTLVQERASIFTLKGSYKFEVVKYVDDSKLTSVSGKIGVKNNLVSIENFVEPYVPIFDTLMNEVDNLDINVSKSEGVTTLTITKKDGSTETVLINDGEPGAQGPQGIQGPKGETGPANTLSIGTVTGGDTASASITGTAPEQTLNLVLPKGDKGDTGSQGPKGDKGDKGETGAQGPKGDAGVDGVDGSDGVDGYSPTATVSKTGSVATITITDKNGTTTTTIHDGESGGGTGDMLKSTYDTNDNGVVDNAEKVNNHTVLTDVPANAVFTDTVVDINSDYERYMDTEYVWTNIDSLKSIKATVSGQEITLSYALCAILNMDEDDLRENLSEISQIIAAFEIPKTALQQYEHEGETYVNGIIFVSSIEGNMEIKAYQQSSGSDVWKIGFIRVLNSLHINGVFDLGDFYRTPVIEFLYKNETKDNKVTSLSSSSTNDEYPSAKAVYDFVMSLIGNN